jgi:hypothetical protein
VSNNRYLENLAALPFFLNGLPKIFTLACRSIRTQTIYKGRRKKNIDPIKASNNA